MPREREPFRAYDGEDREGFAEDLADEPSLERNEFERRFPERGCMPEPHRPSECASVHMMEHLRAEATVEVHHEIPRCLLRLRDHAEAHTEIDGIGIQRWLDYYECEALRFGVDPDVDRDELAAMIEGSTVALSRDDHREAHAGDFARWGQLGRSQDGEPVRYGVDGAARPQALGANHRGGADGGLRRNQRGPGLMATPLFDLGRVVTTPGALALLVSAGENPARLLERHVRGDWGEVPPEDARENEYSLKHGFRVLSAYPVGGDGERVWIITEADRSSTCLLLPEEY